MKKYYIYIILLFFSSCIVTKKRASKNIAKYVKNYPSLIVYDTIKFVDTIPFVVKEIKHDTVFKQVHDSIVIKKDRLTIRYIKKDSLVYLSGECEADTIWEIVHKEVTVPNIQVEKTKHANTIKLLIYLGIILTVGMITRKLTK